jgi:hypothetical protein
MDKAEYFGRLYSDIFTLNPRTSGGLPQAAAGYFEGHKPRFEVQVDFWNEFLDKERIWKVLDVGTGVPFTSYYFNVTQGAEVLFGMLEDPGYTKDDKVRSIVLNLCKDRPALGPLDLVICTECLEHLPCNLYKVAEYLKSLVRPGGFMLLSFPLGGQGRHGPKEYWRDDLGDYNSDSRDHIREFTGDTAHDFCHVTGWDVVKEVTVFTQAYGGQIMNVLLRKPE